VEGKGLLMNLERVAKSPGVTFLTHNFFGEIEKCHFRFPWRGALMTFREVINCIYPF